MKPKNYQSILFDLDGTLTDPKDGIINSVQYALNKMGIAEPEREKLVKFIGPPLAESFQKYFQLQPTEAWKAVQYYREYFTEKGMFENFVYPGIPQLLQELRQRGKRLIVATSKPTIFSEQILHHFKLLDLFEKVIGSNLDGTRVAKTEVIQHVFAVCPIEKQYTVMIGDREHDLIGARGNEIDSIAVTYGYGSRTELENGHPTAIVNSVTELKTVLVAN